MKQMFQAVVVAAAVLAVPALSAAQAAKPAAPAKTTAAKPAAKPAMHSAQGVVKSIDASSLVLTDKAKKDWTFVVDASTKKEGDVAVGSAVHVTYKDDASTHIATDIKAAAAKPAKAAKK
jgi:hypothetical protein